MLQYIVRRTLYAIPILLGVNLITFLLFFGLSSPEHMALQILGEKSATDEDIANWLAERGYDAPRLWNGEAAGMGKVTDTIFARKTLPLFWFDFGASDQARRSITREISRRMGPSLMITTPMFFASVLVNVFFAMVVAFYRGTYLDTWGVVLCVAMMSVSLLFYIIGAQYVLGRMWRLYPISGYDTGVHSLKFVVLPVVIGILGSVGGGVRYYRTLFLEEIGRDYIRTARAKGLSEARVLFVHALKNAMIPILTTVVMSIPFLFMGSLLLENFFAIPGLGSYTIEAIQAQDFAIVRSMVFIGSVMYIVGLILTDVSYTLVDPRVRLE
ncbi:ABC transporter permease [Candidatus Poribacteria bacterium]|jgi:peptide/nickel transport system permease protein|nr:ABC transporter permease [Candidatus Poribacteria bacterium]MBT5536016.1 ABC transporter permease [Candidatus Poribacteria bacterium]MBT7096545.1 ABC transporter permease [Candidatus Poribacteria bacterium]MBT7808429.1 ABC transporter permease [Candidatus Poribacteria bacterium]